MKRNAAGQDLCIYCGTNPATPEYSAMGCGCEDTPGYMHMSAPSVPQKRCVSCGEFAADCECSGRVSRETEFGYGGRVVRS
jgi:hypothetical protein